MKRFFELLVILLIGVLAFFAYQAGWVHQFRNFISVNKPAEVAVPLLEAEVLQRKNDGVVVPVPVNSEAVNIDLNEVQIAADAVIKKYRNWLQSRGQFTETEQGDYLSYNDGTLATLGKQGDLKALRVLSVRYLRSGDIKRSAYFANMAAIFGSTQGLRELAEFVGPTFAPKDPAKARNAALHALAFTKVIEMRGDIELAERTRSAFEIVNRVDLNLTPEEKSYVDLRASELYWKFQSARTAKGLGDFDNSPSPFAKAQ